MGFLNIFKQRSTSKTRYIALLIISRLYTTGILGIASTVSLLIIVNQEFQFFIVAATKSFHLPLYNILLEISKGIFILFIFYFIVVHIPLETKKSALFLLINNNIRLINSIVDRIYTELSISANISLISNLSDDDKKDICKESNERLGEKITNEIVYNQAVRIQTKIDELILMGEYLNPTILRKLTQIKSYEIEQLIMNHELRVSSKDPGEYLFRKLKGIERAINTVVDILEKEYSIYRFEYDNDWWQSRKK